MNIPTIISFNLFFKCNNLIHQTRFKKVKRPALFSLFKTLLSLSFQKQKHNPLSTFQAQKYCFARGYSECGPFYLFSPGRIITHTHTFPHTNPNYTHTHVHTPIPTHTHTFCTTNQHTHTYTPKLNNQSLDRLSLINQ